MSSPFRPRIETIAVRGYKARKAIPLQDIIYLSGRSNYSMYHLAGGKQMLSSYTMRDQETLLPTFLRIGKQHMVNPAHIISVDLADWHRSYVTLSSGDVLKVPRRRVARVRELIENLKTK